MSSEKQRVRNIDYGAENEDLERMQREFLSGDAKPAAKVVRSKNKPPPTVAGVGASADSVEIRPNKDKEPRDDATSLSSSGGQAIDSKQKGSDVLGFAKSMALAIKEFEVKERGGNDDTGGSENRQSGPTEQKFSSVQSSGIDYGAPGGSQQGPKKLSLFAQRRLAMQRKHAPDGSKATTTATATNALVDSEISSSRDSRGAATFLPKLMAPVPEHTDVGPVRAPEIKPRESGFPHIPVDYMTTTATDSARSVQQDHPVDVRSPEYWKQIREQASLENRDRIGAMSDAEIREAQSDIRSMLSNDAVERLLRRKQKSDDGSSKERVSGQTKRVQFAESVQVAAADDAVDGGNSSGEEYEEDPSEAPPPPPPPPPAEWIGEGMAVDVDNNSIGADSEFYSHMKRKYFPNDVVEEAKLAWILGHKQSRSPMEKAISADRKKEASAAAAAAAASGTEDLELLSKPISHVRFGFDGQTISEETLGEIPTTAALHHHGDDPDKPGYTIPELLHLSRSTVPMQRAVALDTLGNIFHKINVGAWDIAQSVETYLCLLDWEAELYLSGGICDANATGRVVATVALWTWVVEMAKYKTLVRLANGGQMEVDADVAKVPGAEIHGMLPQPAPVAKGKLVERTFKALDSMLTAKFMDNVCEAVSLSLLPERQLAMLSECVKQLQSVSKDLAKRVADHGRLLVLLENKFPYLMNKR
ncbi:hypothetical protein H4217_004741 [Coemansia sp. RSA 1939]|nr:hypothetical protein H4217_004741 [Coemansia sp. RSA 1939]KAJ2613493.1 hypothetical protein EV177_002507 [Coemansia sp. RSA 1804]